MLFHIVQKRGLQFPVRSLHLKVEQSVYERSGRHHIREKLEIDGIHTVVKSHAHHAGNGTYSGPHGLLRLRSKHGRSRIGLGDAESGYQSYRSSHCAPYQYGLSLFPELRDKLHDIDLLLFRLEILIFQTVVNFCHGAISL